jgi:excisionase family DNA binding protein
MSRPAEHYLHAGGGIVIVPARVAALLNRAVLDNWRPGVRQVDPELDAVLTALSVAGRKWRGSVTGTTTAAKPELATQSEWLSTTQAATKLGITARGTRKAITDGRLDAQQVAGRWRISRESLAHFRARATHN